MKELLLMLLLLITGRWSGQSNAQELEGQPLRLWATYYYVPTLDHSDEGVDLLDEHGNKTGFKLDECDWCTAAIEGTVFIKKDGRTHTFNYAGRSEQLQQDCRKCKKFKNYTGYASTGRVLWTASSGFGKGVRNYNLVPYKTIAVDPEIIPYGTILFIPQAKGVEYIDENGKKAIHDGLFFAGDTGGAIKGTHIDVFIGDQFKNPFKFVSSRADKTFEAFIVADNNIAETLEKLHR